MANKVWNVEVFKSKLVPNGCIRLSWEGSMGFGQYDIIIDTEYDEFNPDPDYKLKLRGTSEHMDTNEDKKFLIELLKSLTEQIEIIE